ncbi:MAG TPA: HopJ type III effector protein [Algoriphagus sp.]|nr:HopJ type III effector protein [Algoriphagus sp.]
MTLLEKIQLSPESINFQEVIDFIDSNYDFTPTLFTNGDTVNDVGQNNGSCKIFFFAQLQGLSKEQTLALFGDYYRVDVLGKPEGDDHKNIRNFMAYGWEGIQFDGEPLVSK